MEKLFDDGHIHRMDSIESINNCRESSEFRTTHKMTTTRKLNLSEAIKATNTEFIWYKQIHTCFVCVFVHRDHESNTFKCKGFMCL